MSSDFQRKLRAVSDDPVAQLAEALADKIDGLAARMESPPPQKSPEAGAVVSLKAFERIVIPVIIAAVLGLFGFVLNISTRIATIEAGVIELRGRPVPPPQVEFRLTDHERRLDRIENGGNP